MQSRNALIFIYVFLYKCNGRCDTFDNKCGNTCISNKAKDVRAFNIITRINEAIK